MERWNRWQVWMGWISGLFGVVSIAIAFLHGFSGIGAKFDPTSRLKVTQAIFLCIWIVVPPVWFWFEYFFLYKEITPPAAPPLKPTMDEYKHGVDVSSKIWLALVTVLLGLYFGKDLARDSSPSPPCTQPSSEVQSKQGTLSVPSSGELSSSTASYRPGPTPFTQPVPCCTF